MQSMRAAPFDADAPPLRSIRRLSGTETVRGRLGLAVRLGLLKPGERLPTTAAIAAALGVSEMTVRRALSAMTQDGVLVARRGRAGGTFVSDVPEVVGIPAEYEAAADAVRELVDSRLSMEIGIAHCAVGALRPGQLRTLRNLVRSMGTAETWAEFHNLDARFHESICAFALPRASGRYSAVLNELYQFYLPYPVEYLHESNREHERLLLAFERGDVLAATDVACAHVRTLHDTMFMGLLNAQRAPRR